MQKQLKAYKNLDKLFEAVRLMLGTQEKLSAPLSINEWIDIATLLQRQGVVAVALHGLSKLNAKEIGLSQDLILEWTLKSLEIEAILKRKLKLEQELNQKMLNKGISLIVLKGTAFSQYYPKPESRECGDLDCYMFGKKEDGDAAVVAIGGRKVGEDNKHSVLMYKGLPIENHKYFTSFENTKNGIKTEKVLQSLSKEEPHFINSTNLLSPSHNFNAFFLIKHANRHFIKEGISLRQLLDWFFIIRSKENEVDWEKVFSMLRDCRLYNFSCVLTKLCIDYLGLDVTAQPLRDAASNGDSVLTAKVLDDILSEHPSVFNKHIIKRAKRIFRRMRRMWTFRALADETYIRLLWNSFIYNSFIKTEMKM